MSKKTSFTPIAMVIFTIVSIIGVLVDATVPKLKGMPDLAIAALLVTGYVLFFVLLIYAIGEWGKIDRESRKEKYILQRDAIIAVNRHCYKLMRETDDIGAILSAYDLLLDLFTALEKSYFENKDAYFRLASHLHSELKEAIKNEKIKEVKKNGTHLSDEIFSLLKLLDKEMKVSD